MRWTVLILVFLTAAGWVYPDFSYRNAYNLSSPPSTDVPLNFTIDTSAISGLMNQCQDARFSWMNQGEEAVSYWEGAWCGRADTVFWVFAPEASPNETFYFYYNSSQGTESNVSAVFGWPHCSLPFEDTGTVAEDVAGNYNGTYTDVSSGDGPLIKDGIFGNASQFEDTGDAINVSIGAVDGTINFTVEFWINTTKTGQYAILSGANSGQANEVTVMGNSGNLVVYVKGSSHSIPAGLNDGGWHHVAVTRDGSNVSMYVDGGYLGYYEPGADALAIDFNGLWIGQHQDGVGSFASGDELQGYLDELRIYNKSLSSGEISKRMVSGTQYLLREERLVKLKAFSGDGQDDSVTIDVMQGETIIYSSAGNMTEGLEEGMYNVSFSKSFSGQPFQAVFEDVNLSRPFTASLEFNDSYDGYMTPKISAATPILAAVPSGDFSRAKLTIPKNGVPVNRIIHCISWDISTQNCSAWEANATSDYDFSENSTHIIFYATTFDGYGGGDATTDVEVERIWFNTTDRVENQDIRISANISNPGGTDLLNVKIWFNGTDCNGVNYSIGETFVNVSSGGWNYSNITYGFGPCTHVVNVTADPDGAITEDDEGDNWNDTSLTIPLWGYYYGNTSFVKAAQDSEGNPIITWAPPQEGGNIYFIDIDSDVSFNKLWPMNGTDDFNELDLAIGSENFTDGVNDTYDSNGDGVADQTGWFVIFGRNITDVPVVDSYPGSPWVTGLMWDSDDGGTEYDGTQDVVFIVAINDSTQGAFGINDYEARVAALLRNLKGSNSMLAVYMEMT